MSSSDGIVESIFETANDAIITADSAGKVLGWNPAAEETFGYSADEAVGEDLTLIIPDRFHDDHHQGIRRVVETGQTRIIGQTVEVAGRRKDGSELPIELSLATWLDEGERYFAAIVRDISERAQMVEALGASEARLESIVATANDAIATIDALGIVKQWNPHAVDIFGYTPDDIVGEPISLIVPPEFRVRHDAGLLRLARGGEPRIIGETLELVGLHQAGHEFPIELSLAMWDQGEERFYTGIIRDITRRKEAEDQLQETNKALSEKTEMLEALSSKLAKYLSKQVYESIFEGRTEVRVEAYRKKLTVFFSDIQGFTELTDVMEAEAVSELLNAYLSEMSNIAGEHGGTIDKFIGDGVMIFFGDPESHGDREDALACVRMALDMRGKVEELRGDWNTRSSSANLHVRMGINTGYCTVGNFGSEDRLDYTIVGREVNAASRLENSAERGQIQLSNTTYELVKDQIATRPVGEISVKGLAHNLKTHEALGIKNE